MSDPMFHRIPTSPSRSLRGSSVKTGSLSATSGSSTATPRSSTSRVKTNGGMTSSQLADSVLITAGFSLVPKVSKTYFRAQFSPTPAHTNPETESARLSAQIKDFLKRSDHIEQDWNKSVSKSTKNRGRLRSSNSKSHSCSVDRYPLDHSETLSLLEVPSPFDDDDEDDKTENDNPAPIRDEVGPEMTPTVAAASTALTASQPHQRHLDSLENKYHSPEFQKKCTLLKLQGTNMKYTNSCGLMVSELNVELSEDQNPPSEISLNKDAKTLTNGHHPERRFSQLSSTNNNYSTLDSRRLGSGRNNYKFSVSDCNGDQFDVENDQLGETVYKQRWERARRELEILRHRLAEKEQEHLDQTIHLKKSLERVCSDAREETEEQRGIVSQLKKQMLRMNTELSDFRSLLQEETTRSALTEKKERRLEQDMAELRNQLMLEKQNSERILQEKDAVLAQIQGLQNEIQNLNTEMKKKVSRIQFLESDMDQTSQVDETDHLRVQKKAKDLELRLEAQDEELDDLRAQVEQLEAIRSKLKIRLEDVVRDRKTDAQRWEEELDFLQSSFKKKITMLEFSLNEEIDRKMGLLRNKQELERRLAAFEAAQKEALDRNTQLKASLRKTKALLKDAQRVSEQAGKSTEDSKGMLQKLSEDLAKERDNVAQLSRAKQKTEDEIEGLQRQLTEISRTKLDFENQKLAMGRERTKLEQKIAKIEQETAEAVRKYKDASAQLAKQAMTMTDQSIQISRLESSNRALKDTVTELTRKLDAEKRNTLQITDLETKGELDSLEQLRLERELKTALLRIRDLTEALNTSCPDELSEGDDEVDILMDLQDLKMTPDPVRSITDFD